jgi:plasmid maintenance system antidote protein VapI
MEKIINAGGINGIGSRAVDIDSADFKAAQEQIATIVANRSTEERINTHLLGLRFRMMSYLEEAHPNPIRPVGIFLKEFVQLLGIQHGHFASYIQYEPSNLSAIYSGSRKMNLRLASVMEQLSAIPALLWLSVQNKNELLKLQREEVDAERFSLKELLEVKK